MINNLDKSLNLDKEKVSGKRDKSSSYQINSLSANESTKRSELPDSIFGIPSKRKFPLDTESRVRSAIRFFNYAEKSDERELANNIIAKIKEYNIKDLKPSDKNRFYDYYTPEVYDISTEVEFEFEEDDIVEESIIDIPQKIINFFVGDTTKEFQLQKWKDKLELGGNLIGGTPVQSKYITLSKVLVDNRNQVISIQHINFNVLIKRMRKIFGERKLDYIFDRTYDRYSINRFNKKMIPRSSMNVTSLTTPTFFALELTIIFKELYKQYRNNVYLHIANEIYKNSWLSESDKKTPPKIDMSRLNNLNPKYKLKDYQEDFIKAYPNLKTQLGLRGYYLAFEQGLGKTLTACALAEVLSVDKVYIVCPNTLTPVWFNETKDYFNGKYEAIICSNKVKQVNSNTKYFITNQESIKNLFPYVDSNCKSMIVVDEAHNFRNINSIRVNELISLKERLEPTDILMMSGTPIKATPNELTPALRMLDDKFTDHAAKIYNACFKFDSYMAMDIVRERFGQVIYRKTKSEVLSLPEKTLEDIKVKVKNADKYLISNVKAAVYEVFLKRYKELVEENKETIKFFKENILKYSIADKSETNNYINKVIRISNESYKETLHSYHELDQDFINNFITNYIQTNRQCGPNTLKKLREYEKKLIFIMRSAMGTAIGAIYPKYRAEMFNAMYDENKELFINMINNNDKKTVIFSQSLPVIKHISDDLNKTGIATVRIVGGTSSTVRADIIDKFKNDELVKVICATSQSMSTGVTLTEANQMFFFGPPWRAADYQQAQDRIHRIGQDTDVNIYNVILDSEEMNLSDRMDTILKWSGDMAEAAIEDL